MEELEQEVTGNENEAQAASGILDVVNETVSYAVYRKKGADEKAALGFGLYKEGNALYKKINGDFEADGKTVKTEPDTDLLHQVSITYPTAHSIAGISKIVKDEDEAVAMFNDGMDARLTSQLRAYFTQVNEGGDLVHGDETSMDVDATTDIVNTPLKRRALTEVQKATKVLKGISPDSLAEALKAMGIVI